MKKLNGWMGGKGETHSGEAVGGLKEVVRSDGASSFEALLHHPRELAPYLTHREDADGRPVERGERGVVVREM